MKRRYFLKGVLAAPLVATLSLGVAEPVSAESVTFTPGVATFEKGWEIVEVTTHSGKTTVFKYFAVHSDHNTVGIDLSPYGNRMPDEGVLENELLDIIRERDTIRITYP